MRQRRRRRCRVRKQRIPVRGLKHNMAWFGAREFYRQVRKQRIPVRGLKQTDDLSPLVDCGLVRKQRIPVRGLKPRARASEQRRAAAAARVRKQRIPVRGLKQSLQKHREPAPTSVGQKTTNPREGIETQIIPKRCWAINWVRKQRIPVRGLKQLHDGGACGAVGRASENNESP